MIRLALIDNRLSVYICFDWENELISFASILPLIPVPLLPCSTPPAGQRHSYSRILLQPKTFQDAPSMARQMYETSLLFLPSLPDLQKSPFCHPFRIWMNLPFSLLDMCAVHHLPGRTVPHFRFPRPVPGTAPLRVRPVSLQTRNSSEMLRMTASDPASGARSRRVS